METEEVGYTPLSSEQNKNQKWYKNRAVWIISALFLASLIVLTSILIIHAQTNNNTPTSNAITGLSTCSSAAQCQLISYASSSPPTTSTPFKVSMMSMQVTAPWILPTNWGGSNPSIYTSDTLFANAASAELTRAWALPDVADVVCSVPTSMQDSGFHPYGDGQSNARTSFGAWTAGAPPLISTLIRFKSTSPVAIFRFAAAWKLSQTQLEVYYSHSSSSVFLDLSMTPNGDFVAQWSDIPPQLGWDAVAHNQVILVRPSPNFSDWLPVYFRQPVQAITAMVNSLPSNMATFPANGAPVLDSEHVGSQYGGTPFDNLINHSWSSSPNIWAHFEVDPVHGTFGDPSNPGTPRTAVGKGWTWVANNAANGGNAPFKILYTCFQRRQPQQEALYGVTSGGGWHRIGDNAETIFNSLESVPAIVGFASQQPANQVGLSLPSGNFAYGLSDIAVIRWLAPGEAMVTPKTYFHWFMFQQDSEVCTEEWVHPCVPADPNGSPTFAC